VLVALAVKLIQQMEQMALFRYLTLLLQQVAVAVEMEVLVV
jgi:hypothetical protein